MTEPAAVAGVEEAPELEGGFSRRTLRWVIAGAVVSFVAAALLSVYGRDLENRPSPEANTFSYSAIGHHALAELLRAMGLGVFSRQTPAGKVGPDRPLVLAEPEEKDLEHLKALRGEARDLKASFVLVLPKWAPGPPERERPDWLSEVRLMVPEQVQHVPRGIGDDALKGVEVVRSNVPLRCPARWGSSEVELRIDSVPVQLLAPSPELTPVVECDGGYLIARRAGAEPPRTYLIADPDLLNNQGLSRGGNAEGIYQFFTHDLAASGVVFDETIHGFNRAPGLLAEALRFPLVLGTLQSLLLLGAVLWAGTGRFGKPLPAAPPLGAGKTVLIDNTAKLLVNGGHAGEALRLYFRQTTRAVAAHYFLPADLTERERVTRLQRLTEGRGQKLSLAALENGIERLPPGRRGGEQAARLARRLYEWRWEMMNGNRQGP